MCWHPHCSLWIAVPSSSYFSHGLVPTLLAQGLPFPFKSGCMWGVLDDSWHTLMLDHVADCRLAWFTCSTSSSEREPWPCPRPLPQQGGSSASSSCCSWDLWGRMWVCVFRGLGGSAGWGQCKDFCCFPVCSVPLLLECWFLQWCCLWTWFGGMHFLTLCYIPFPDWWEGLFLQSRVFWDLYPSYLFDIVLAVDTFHACLCHGSVPQTSLRSQVAQGQAFALWLADV